MGSNLKKGKFKESELKLYGLNEKDVGVILEYQKKLPILQEDNVNWIDARDLHKQLEVGAKFADWIKRRIKKYEFVEGVDFISFHKSEKAENTYINTKEYKISLDMAKQLTMIENNTIGNIARKYFIAIEKAFKFRHNWNHDSQETITKFFNLKKIVMHNSKKLSKYLPDWWYLDVYAYELHRINEIVIGMSSKKFKKKYSIKSNIRNYFSEEQLEYIHALERKSAEYIYVDKLYDTDMRMELLDLYYQALKNNVLSV